MLRKFIGALALAATCSAQPLESRLDPVILPALLPAHIDVYPVEKAAKTIIHIRSYDVFDRPANIQDTPLGVWYDEKQHRKMASAVQTNIYQFLMAFAKSNDADYILGSFPVMPPQQSLATEYAHNIFSLFEPKSRYFEELEEDLALALHEEKLIRRSGVDVDKRIHEIEMRYTQVLAKKSKIIGERANYFEQEFPYIGGGALRFFMDKGVSFIPGLKGSHIDKFRTWIRDPSDARREELEDYLVLQAIRSPKPVVVIVSSGSMALGGQKTSATYDYHGRVMHRDNVGVLSDIYNTPITLIEVTPDSFPDILNPQNPRAPLTLTR